MNQPLPTDNRRDFLRGSSMMLASTIPAGLATTCSKLQAATAAIPPPPLRIGLIGCGKRGVDAALRTLAVGNGQCQLVALADPFADKLHQAARTLKGKYPETYLVDAANRFCGLQSIKNLCDSDVNLVIAAVPPKLVPELAEHAVTAGKHLFVEPPVGICSTGVRRFIAASDRAREQSLTLAVGLQRRSAASMSNTIEQVRGGAIGKLLFGRAYCNVTATRLQPPAKRQSASEHRLRTWRAFEELSGGPIVEEHVHGIDVFNWILGEHPWTAGPVGTSAAHAAIPVMASESTGTVPTVSATGNAAMAVEFCYRDGFKLYSQIEVSNDPHTSSEWIYGTAGHCDLSLGKIFNNRGQLVWRSEANRDGFGAQIENVVAAIQASQPINNAAAAADATLAAILGRTSLATSTRVRWNESYADRFPNT